MILFTKTFIGYGFTNVHEMLINEKMITRIQPAEKSEHHLNDTCEIFLVGDDYVIVDGSLNCILERIKSTEL